jgi:hypothetical protein
VIRLYLFGLLLVGASWNGRSGPDELAAIVERAETLDGSRVEFDAYVAQLEGWPLMAVSGTIHNRADGTRAVACLGDEKARLPVFPQRGGRLMNRREMADGPRLPKVRISARLRNQPVTVANPRCLGLCDEEYPRYFDNAVIVKRYEQSEACLRT